MTVLLAGQADRGGINDGRKAFQVFNQEPIEKDFIPIEQGDQSDVLLQRITFGENMFKLDGDLLFDTEHCGRKHAFDSKPLTLGMREGQVSVSGGVAEDFLTMRPTNIAVGPAVHKYG
jgi:hypothetical protein